jgi:hypothetical protein
MATSTLAAYRDDGPLVSLAARLAGSEVRIPSVVLTVLGAAPLVVVLVIGARAGDTAIGVATGWFVLLGGLAAARPQTGALGWLVPPILRVVEYSYLIRLVAISDPGAAPLCYALLAALAFHHYDIVYRLRHQQIEPPAWVRFAGFGWEGRLIIAYVLYLTGGLGTAMAVAATVLGVVYLTESTIGWLRFSQAQRPSLYEDEQDEDE